MRTLSIHKPLSQKISSLFALTLTTLTLLILSPTIAQAQTIVAPPLPNHFIDSDHNPYDCSDPNVENRLLDDMNTAKRLMDAARDQYLSNPTKMTFLQAYEEATRDYTRASNKYRRYFVICDVLTDVPFGSIS